MSHVESTNDQLSVVDGEHLYHIYKEVGGNFSKNEFSLTIRKTFPSVSITRSWSKFAKRTGTCYHGIRITQNDAAHCRGINFSEFTKYIPEGFFVINAKSSEFHTGMLCNESANGHKIMKEVFFLDTGRWYLHVAGKQVDLEKNKIDSSFQCTALSVRTICEIVDKIRLCSGVNKNKFQNLDSNEYILSERWSDFNQNSTDIFRSVQCNRVVQMTNIISLCRKCRDCVFFHSNKSNITDQDHLHLNEMDSNEFEKILEEVLPNADKNLFLLIQSQKENLSCFPKQRRWDKSILRLCLTIWSRSKKAYDQIKRSGFLTLPSGRLLQYYQNNVKQTPGLSKEVFKWMQLEAEKQKLSPENREGGILFDEMSIQDDLVIEKANGISRIVGFVDTGVEGENMRYICNKNNQKQLATHVLQFIFLGFNGFRFPFAHFPTTQTTASELHFMFWEAVKMLNMYGFTVCFSSQDGAQVNRDFVNMFFRDLPEKSNYSIRNIWYPLHPNIVLLMDFSHVIKRVRNNISKSWESGDSNGNQNKCIRTLKNGDHLILWDHWIQAFKWDHDTNPFPIHRKLTYEHFYLTPQSKMRNQLAEDALDQEMLHLMQLFQKFLGGNGDEIQGSVDLLKHTSTLISCFRDKRPIYESNDLRLQKNIETLHYFQQWEEQVSKSNLKPCEKERSLISKQTRDDLKSLILGFDYLCNSRISRNGYSVTPCYINSDPIENIFCQERGIHNGLNTNPTYYQYSKAINSVILGEKSISRKSNTGGIDHCTQPITFYTKSAVNPRKRKQTLRI